MARFIEMKMRASWRRDNLLRSVLHRSHDLRSARLRQIYRSYYGSQSLCSDIECELASCSDVCRILMLY